MSEENKEINNLRRFGNVFQSKCLGSLISDRAFLERIIDILSPDYFEIDAHKWVIKFIMEYFPKYREIPTMEVFAVEIQKMSDCVMQASVKDQVKSAYKQISSTDIVYVKEQFLEFCKNQKLRKAIWDAQLYLNQGDYESIWKVINEASKAGMERDMGHNYYVDIDKRMADSVRDIIKTNWDLIDTHLDGGLGKGELGFICAPSGAGKSWFLSRIGVEAMKQGKNVMHFTMELNEKYVGLRYDACFTGIAFQEIRKNTVAVKQAISQLKSNGGGQLFIKYFPLKTVSAATLKMYVDRLQLITGVKIDLMVVDYADILRPFTINKNSNSYNESGDVYEELRTILGELQIPGWTASQSNRCLTLDTSVVVSRNNLDDIVDVIKNVKVGDKLLTHDGYKRVSYIHPIQIQPVYRIRLKSGKTITCSSNHEFPVKYGVLKSIQSGLSVGDELFTKKVIF